MLRPPRITPIAINLAPMVDVMMCMLIFFMLATKMVERENSTIDLPLALAAKAVDRADLGSRIVVNVRKTETAAEYVIDEQTVDLETLYLRLDRARQAAGSEEINCIIRAEKTVPYRYVERVLSGCSKAKIRSVTFSALQGEGGAS